MIQMPPAAQLDFLNNAYIVAANWHGHTLHLYKGLNVNPPLVPADVIECDFTGYSANTPTPAPRITPDLQEGFYDEAPFIASGSTVTNTALGWYVLDSGGTKLLAWEAFATGYPFTSAASAMVLTVNVVIPTGAGWGYSAIA
jgi:hypothetical protein